MVQDAGSGGLLAAHWLHQHAGLRTTTMEDPLHLNFNDVKDAIVRAGCWICIVEHAVVHNGPLWPLVGRRRSVDS